MSLELWMGYMLYSPKLVKLIDSQSNDKLSPCYRSHYGLDHGSHHSGEAQSRRTLCQTIVGDKPMPWDG
jgi:hypothetical protein